MGGKQESKSSMCLQW